MNKKLLLLFFIVSFSSVNVSYSQCYLECHTEGSNGMNCYYYVNAVLGDGGTCSNFNPKVHIAVMDSCMSCTPWNNDSCPPANHYFGQLNYSSSCGGTSTCLFQPMNSFQFDLTNSVQVDSLISMLNNKIPYGFHLLAYTTNVYNYSSLSQYVAFINAFINLGSVMMNTLPDNVPFIFYVKKGYPWTFAEIHGNTASDTIDLFTFMNCNPAGVNEIENIYSDVSLFPNPATDEFKVESSKLKVEAVEVYDVVGGKVKVSVVSGQLSVAPQQLSTDNYQLTLDVSKLAPGIYFVRIKTENGSVTKKLIKQ